MAKCVHCSYRFSWLEMCKYTMIVKKDIVACPKCSQKLFFTAKARKRLSLSAFLTAVGLPAFVVIFTLLKLSPAVTSWILVLYTALLILLTPFAAEVTDKDEALF